MKKISLDEKFALFDEHWRPKTIAALNGQEIKLVKVKGIGFTPSSTVSFGGLAASSVTFVSAKQLDATVPAGATSEQIEATNTATPAGTVKSAAAFVVP